MNNGIKTPYFLIKEEILCENIFGFKKALRDIWPNSQIAYSVKTNALPWILQWMNEHDIYAEVVSDEEYKLAALAGYPQNRIIFNGPIKGENVFQEAVKNKSIINIDSNKELQILSTLELQETDNIGLRINVDPIIFSKDDVGFQEDGFRFGFNNTNGDLLNAMQVIQKGSETKRFGFHLHVNSITRSVSVYRHIARYCADIIKQYNIEPSYIDIGGGFFGGVPGKTTPEEYIMAIREELEKAVNPQKTKLIIEPGSAAIGSAVELHTTVHDVKDTVYARIVTTDGSRIHIDPLWLKKSYTYSTDASKKAHPKQIVCGYTCMDHDRIMTIENQPELSVNDHIVYYRVGNYTITFGGPFIKPYPPVYVESNQKMILVRKEMTIEDYYRMESV